MARKNEQFTVALAVGYPGGFEDEIVRGALDYAAHVDHWQFHGQGHRPFMPFDQIDLDRVDGVIGLFGPHMVVEVDQAGICAVNTSTRFEDLPLPRVGNDDVAMGRLGAEHLLKLGFAHFGFLAGSPAWYAERRLAGFAEVLEQRAGRECRVFRYEDSDLAAERDSLSNWLGALPKPIAIMAANDATALEAIENLVALGLRIPEDVAVLGVDNDMWASAMSPVPISSVSLNARQIGYRAAELLDRLMAGEPPPREPQWISPTGVVIRRSTDIVLAEDVLVVDALRFIREQCGQGIHVEDVLDELAVSRRTLENRMKRAIGKTPQVAIFQAQVEQAKKLLISSDWNLGDIGRACGFSRPERFSLVFKRLVGLTPGQFRQRQITGQAVAQEEGRAT